MFLTFRLSDKLPEPSMCVEDLNNKLTKMRKVVQGAKHFVMHDLTRSIKKLRIKISKLDNKIKIQRKLDNKLSDVRLLKRLSVNRLCKRLLAEELDDCSIEDDKTNVLNRQDRLIERLKKAKPVLEFVRSFREQHTDWKSLIHYLLYKNISGKWKSKEQKGRSRKVFGHVPLPPISVKLGENEIQTHDQDGVKSYRIESKTPDLVVDEFKPEDDDEAMDSDAASDIADMLINNYCDKSALHTVLPKSNRNKPNELDDQINIRKFDNCRTKSSNEVVGGDEKSLDSFSSNEEKSSIFVHDESKFPSIAGSDDDEDPLGNDDANLKSKIAKRNFLHVKSETNRMGRKRIAVKSRPKRSSDGRGLKIKRESKKLASELAKPNIHPSWAAKREQKVILKIGQKSALSTHIAFEED